MPGTSKGFATPNIPQGPADVWINTALPADTSGTTITLHTDLTPESVANPSVVHLGKIDPEGLSVIWKPTFEGQLSDETSAPYRYALGGEEAVISGRWLQLLDGALLEKMTPGATRTTPSGKDLIDFGGLTSFSTYPISVVWKMAEDATKAVVFTLFKAFNEAGLDFNVKRGADSRSAFSFRGMAISTRTAGRQIGQMWRQT